MKSRKVTLILVVLFALMFAAGQTAFAESSSSGGGGSGGQNHHNPKIDVNVENDNNFNPTNEFNPMNCVSAEGGEGGNAQATGGDAKSNSNAVSGALAVIRQGDITYEDRVQGVTPRLPGQLWHGPTPEEKFFWNQFHFPAYLLEGMDWSRKSVNSTLGNTGEWFAQYGVGFKKKAYPSGHKKTNGLDFFKVACPDNPEPVNWADILAKYDIMKPINVGAGKKFNDFEAISYAVKLALDRGATGCVLVYGSNTINNGTSAGIGGTHVDSDGGAASTGLISWGSADSRKESEPGASLLPLRAKVKESSASTSTQAPTQTEITGSETTEQPKQISFNFKEEAAKIAEFWLSSDFAT